MKDMNKTTEQMQSIADEYGQLHEASCGVHNENDGECSCAVSDLVKELSSLLTPEYVDVRGKQLVEDVAIFNRVVETPSVDVGSNKKSDIPAESKDLSFGSSDMVMDKLYHNNIEKIKQELKRAFEQEQDKHLTGLTIVTTKGFDFIMRFFEPYLQSQSGEDFDRGHRWGFADGVDYVLHNLFKLREDTINRRRDAQKEALEKYKDSQPQSRSGEDLKDFAEWFNDRYTTHAESPYIPDDAVQEYLDKSTKPSKENEK